jgi:uncharacterized damage-inducible protein DinB
MQPDRAAFLLSGVFLPAAKNEHRLTKAIIEAIPLDKGDYRPDDVAKTALELAWHIVATEMRFLASIAAGEFDLTPRPRPDAVTNSHEMAIWYEEHFAALIEKVDALSPEQLAKIIDFRGMMQLPAVMFMDMMMHHSVHHRGQLSMYLRPMGAKVPSIYGESYDAAQARKAAAS